MNSIGISWQNYFLCHQNFGLSKLKAMNIEQTEFLLWMKRIMERFDILNENIRQQQKLKGQVDGEELLDNQDVLQMLKISPRSLQRYRSSGRLPYYTISGKVYYKQSDVQEFIRDSFSMPVREKKYN